MKFKQILYTSALAALLFTAGSCKKDRFDINTNPDDITEATVLPSTMLAAALQNTSKLVDADWRALNMWLGHWARNGTYQSLNEIETYRFTNDFEVVIWNDLYANLANYNLMQKRAEASNAGFYEAVGRIMKAHDFQILVDVYNNVPYTEAFNGTKIKTPKYDKGQDIYTDLFKQLDTAIALLNDPAALLATNNPDLATSDLVYHGSAVLWKKLANTLRLRMLVHLHNGLSTIQVAPGFNIAEQMSKITTDGFLGNGESAELNPGFSTTKPNPFYRDFVENESGTQRGEIYRANEYAIDYYGGNADPRISRFYVAPAGGHAGTPFGRPSDGDPQHDGANLSTVRGPGLIPNGAASRAWILTSVESMFLQAEARQLGILTTGATAKARLTAAIRESFVWLGLTATQADTYITTNAGYPDVDYDAPSLIPGQPGGGHYTILSQKWFALNNIAPFELWSDYRRSDFVLGAAIGFDPGPPISIDPGNTATRIPRRLFYPQNEYNYNATNVAAEGAINVFTGKVFWDLN